MELIREFESIRTGLLAIIIINVFDHGEGVRRRDSKQTSAEADVLPTKPNQLQGSITYRRKLRRFLGECKVQCCLGIGIIPIVFF